MIELDVLDAVPDEEGADGKRFWRSPAQLERSAAFKEANDEEFRPGASEEPDGASRRQFLQLMGASMAMAGLTACRRPVEKILPYARKPEEVIPGVAQHYATGMPFQGVLRPLLVESHEGRPTKIEGNADHPDSSGATSAFEQASVLNLYDPDRSRTVLQDGSEASWEDFVRFCRRLADGAADRNVAVLAPPTSSPTMQAMRDRMGQRFPNLQWIEYSATGDDPVRMGMQQAFGRPLRPRYAFDETDVVVGLDADFLAGADRDYLHNTRTFAQSRRLESPEDEMSRLYMVESSYSTTGGLADNRLRMRASRIPAYAAALAQQLGLDQGPQADLSTKEQRYVEEMARDLQEAGTNGVVLAGDTQPPAVHALCMAINERLGSLGTTVTLLDPQQDAKRPQADELAALTDDMRAGRIDALFMVDVNPVYDAPAALGFRQALQSVGDAVHLGLHVDETARASRWHVPKAHYLESWSDGRTYDGTLSVIQPLIRPLYDDAHSAIEVMNTAATGIDASGYDLVREQWRERISGRFEDQWREVLHDGYLPNSQYATVSTSVSTGNIAAIPAPSNEDLEVVFRLDPKLLDGRFSNNAWMQELPDPITKIVWDNVATMSPSTADELGLNVAYSEGKDYADRIDLTVDGETVNLPVWIQPGYPDGTIGVNLGYGRALSTVRSERNAPFWDTTDYTDIYGQGPVAGGVNESTGEPDDAVGVRTAHLRPTDGVVATGASVSKTGSGYLVATTQEHGSMEGRPIVRYATLDEYRENPNFADDMGPPVPGAHGEEGGHGEGGHGGGSHGGDGAAHGGDGAMHDSDAHSAHANAHDDTTAHGGGEHGGDGHGEGHGEGGASFRTYPTLWEENHPKDTPAMKDNPYYQNQWGMVIDLNTCMGCNACIVACTSENNVQVVGKEQVSKGRHMYWLRMDRYYVSEDGDMDDPEMLTQPVMCQHCENAPCESVCPVAATVHSPDGTNQMIYNRCIGTRYCSNNCPYKVRRFNFYNWTKTLPAEVQMAQNPNVTVRSRGVMEKCSWCIHRVRDAQSQADNENRDLRADEIETACQQACPTDSIVFGDLNNEESTVVKEKKNSRRYELLDHLNVKPRLSYLGRVRNPNPRLEDLEEDSSAEPTEEAAA
jgi:molybdopterin-containing oxidoreductase family iron-sulfur binding subunit